MLACGDQQGCKGREEQQAHHTGLHDHEIGRKSLRERGPAAALYGDLGSCLCYQCSSPFLPSFLTILVLTDEHTERTQTTGARQDRSKEPRDPC